MKNILFILIMSVLVACAPSESSIQTAIAQTQIAAPTNTQQPTITDLPQPTKTLIPSPTSTPTETQTPTVIPPMTQTAQVIALTMTKAAKDIFATQESYTSKLTATAKAISVEATHIASYKTIDYRELVSYAERHKGEKVKIQVKIFNVVGSKELQGYFVGTYDAVYITMSSSFTGLYEDNYIYVYGVVGGDYCFENAYNATICQPLIEKAWYQK